MIPLPPGACDCHVHLFEPGRFPYAEGRNYTPPAATVDDLLAFERSLGFDRVVLVQASVYGADNRCLLDGLRRLGERARGVAVIDAATTEAALDELGAAGIRGVRLNLEAEGMFEVAATLDRLREAAARVRGRGWHVQLATALPVLVAIADKVAALGVPMVLDHFASASAAAGTGQPSFRTLLDLLGSAELYVKLSGAYRVSSRPDHADLSEIAQALIEASPGRMLWASDWPHTGPRRPGHGPDDVDPFQDVDDRRILGLLAGWAPDPAVRRRILADNPARLYGFGGLSA